MPVNPGAEFKHGRPQRLFQVQNVRPDFQFSVSRDGRRILMPTITSAQSRDRITVMTNWLALAKKQ